MSQANERAYQRIRDAIVAGEFPAGAHLAEQRLAEITGVSRTPVREALRRLDAERFVHFVPNRGAYVADWSTEAMDEIYRLRGLLEAHAAERAAVRIAPRGVDTLAECVARIDAEIGAERVDLDAVMAANHRFHTTILEAAESSRLVTLLQSLVETPMILKTLANYRHEDLVRSNHHHAELVAACRAGDSEWAGAVMTAHLRAARQILV